MPQVVVIAGPNGAGKTTASEAIIARALGVGEFVNADTIARGLSGFSPEAAAVQAGRIMLARLQELAESGQNFAFETTLASRSFARIIAAWKTRGYEFELVFVWLPNAAMAMDRVRGRVARGGHDIPPDVIRRRYERGLSNFFNLYLPIADRWTLLDNSAPGSPRLIAEKWPDGEIRITRSVQWESIRGRHMGTTEPGGGKPPHAAEPPALDPRTERMLREMNKAVYGAVREHKLLGFPIVVWDDEKQCPKIVPPEDIRLEDYGDSA